MSVLAALEVAFGFILWLILPSGGGYMGGRGLLTEATFLSWPRHSWLGFHNWLGVALLAVVLVHIIVHRKWIVSMTKKLRRN